VRKNRVGGGRGGTAPLRVRGGEESEKVRVERALPAEKDVLALSTLARLRVGARQGASISTLKCAEMGGRTGLGFLREGRVHHQANGTVRGGVQRKVKSTRFVPYPKSLGLQPRRGRRGKKRAV